MKKYVIVLCCEDSDGGTYSDCTTKLYDTKEEAEKGVEEAIKNELETLGEGFSISEYNPWEIVDAYESRVSTYDVFEVEMSPQKKEYVYSILSPYDSDMILGELVFDHALTSEERDKIQRCADKIKEKLIDDNCDFQTYEVLEELHRYFDFEDRDVQGNVFYI